MVFYVILVTFLMTLIVYKFTTIVIWTYLKFMWMSIIETKFDIFLRLNIYVMNLVIINPNLDEKSLTKW